jgi:hypothetical protein
VFQAQNTGLLLILISTTMGGPAKFDQEHPIAFVFSETVWVAEKLGVAIRSIACRFHGPMFVRWMTYGFASVSPPSP